MAFLEPWDEDLRCAENGYYHACSTDPRGECGHQAAMVLLFDPPLPPPQPK